jgi:hypothetical protein
VFDFGVIVLTFDQLLIILNRFMHLCINQ